MKNIFYFVTIFALASRANALGPSIPARAPKCGANFHVRSPPKGAGVLLNETCDIAFVLPPTEAITVVTGVAPGANLGFCPTVNGRVSAAAALQQRIDNAVAALNEDAQPRDPDDPFAPPARSSSDDLVKLSETIREVTLAQNQLLDGIKQYAGLEAATVSVVFNMNYQQLVEQYAARNPGLTFMPLELKNAAFSFLPKNITKTDTMPAVLSADVPGIEFGDTPSTGSPLPDTAAGEDKRYSNETTQSLVFSNALSGQIVLSMIGGCAFYSQNTINPHLSGRELPANLVANVTYSYDLQASAKYHAEYNLTSLVKRMIRSTTSGGLFSTSSAVDVINEQDSSDWFKFTSESDDSDFQILVDEKDVKADLIDRVIREVGYVSVEGTGKIPDPAAAPVHGAEVAADGLSKCMHIYCQAAAIGLRVLDSIFGSSEVAQNFMAHSDFWARDDVSKKRMIRYRGTTAFVSGTPSI